ncbi:MAG TPA: histidine utilization repressor, partial [Pseudomonas sp.]|nr:histidine utilization repressor [Pseudomonas sp.]
KKGEPCLLIRRRTWSGRQPVTAARLIHPGSRHRLEGRFHK